MNETKTVFGWGDDEAVMKALEPPMAMKDNLGRDFDIISWEPRVAVNDVVTVTVKLLVKVPKGEAKYENPDLPNSGYRVI